METIKEVIKIINKRKLQNVEILDKSTLSHKDSLYSKFYFAMVDDLIQTEDDAINLLYGKIDINEINSFRQFKSRFKKRILNTFFFLDINNKDYETEVQKNNYECLRTLQVINIIQKYGGNQHLIYKIIKDYFNIALKYEFHEILHEYCYRLCTYYAITGELKKLIEYKELYKKYHTYHILEQQAYLIFTEVNGATNSIKPVDVSFYESKIKEIDALRLQTDSYTVHGYYYICLLMYNDYICNTALVEKYSNELLKLIDTKDNLLRQNFKGIANIFKIEVMLKHKEYVHAIDYVDNNANTFLGLNYFRSQEIKFKSALNLQNTELCTEIFNDVTTHKLFETAPNNVKEKWYIFDGYANFLMSYTNNEPYKYNIAKLTNQLPTYYHDKSGYNFSLIILQILFHIARKEFDNASVKIQNLKIYKTRYFSDSKHQRTKQFIKTLLYLDNNAYNKRNTGSLLIQFQKSREKNAYIYDHEIVIFETTLEIIYNLL